MFKKLFGKKDNDNHISILAPLNGQVLDITEVPDPVFSQKMMGEGIAINPAEGLLVSPVDGEVVTLFHTKHAIGLKTKTGIELLIHIGLETVNLNGEGFQAFVAAGYKVKVGQKLIEFDLEMIREKAASTITPIIITNVDAVKQIDKKSVTQATAGETELLAVSL